MTTSPRSSAGDLAYVGASFAGDTGESGQAETDVKGEVLTVAHTDDDLDLDIDDRPALEVVASPPQKSSRVNVPRLFLIGLDVLAVVLAWTFSYLAPWTDWSGHAALRRYWVVIGISSAATPFTRRRSRQRNVSARFTIARKLAGGRFGRSSNDCTAPPEA